MPARGYATHLLEQRVHTDNVPQRREDLVAHRLDGVWHARAGGWAGGVKALRPSIKAQQCEFPRQTGVRTSIDLVQRLLRNV